MTAPVRLWSRTCSAKMHGGQAIGRAPEFGVDRSLCAEPGCQVAANRPVHQAAIRGEHPGERAVTRLRAGSFRTQRTSSPRPARSGSRASSDPFARAAPCQGWTVPPRSNGADIRLVRASGARASPDRPPAAERPAPEGSLQPTQVGEGATFVRRGDSITTLGRDGRRRPGQRQRRLLRVVRRAATSTGACRPVTARRCAGRGAGGAPAFGSG